MKNRNATLHVFALQCAICAICILPLASCSQSGAQPTLDGKSFIVVSIPDGQSSEDMVETISFANGMFDDDGCHVWGFGTGAATYGGTEEKTTFEATTTSATDGSMMWKGTVSDGKISGEMIWHKEGQADIKYHFKSMEADMVSLDGRSFDLNYMVNDSMTTEKVTFKGGKFESPACYEWGFSPAPYLAWRSGNDIKWQSIYASEKEGYMIFSGKVNGGNIEGSQYWHKDGQADETTMISGMEAK